MRPEQRAMACLERISAPYSAFEIENMPYMALVATVICNSQGTIVSPMEGDDFMDPVYELIAEKAGLDRTNKDVRNSIRNAVSKLKSIMAKENCTIYCARIPTDNGFIEYVTALSISPLTHVKSYNGCELVFIPIVKAVNSDATRKRKAQARYLSLGIDLAFEADPSLANDIGLQKQLFIENLLMNGGKALEGRSLLEVQKLLDYEE